jgi:SAM-dependent methyltransferase
MRGRPRSRQGAASATIGGVTEEQAAHWQRVYAERGPDEMSWTEAVPEVSLALIEEADLPREAAILDVGGGASHLARELLRAGYTDLTVADISPGALEQAAAEIGADAERVAWVEADVRGHDFGRRFDLWHDRAVFHFMVEPEDRAAYLATLERALRPGGHLVVATFGPEGPTECSGLPVRRYDAAALSDALGPHYEPISSRLVAHRTPSGREQQFHYAHMRRVGS